MSSFQCTLQAHTCAVRYIIYMCSVHICLFASMYASMSSLWKSIIVSVTYNIDSKDNVQEIVHIHCVNVEYRYHIV